MAVVPIPLARSRVTVQVGEAEFECELDVGGLEDLQSLTGLGPEKIIERLVNRDYFVGEVREIIRLGLIGGGMNPPKALEVMNRNVKPPYLQFYVPVAYTILLAAIAGFPEHDPLGEPPAAPMMTEFGEMETNEVSGDFPNSIE